MKAKKLAAFLAAALAVTSLNVTAFAATDETVANVTGLSVTAIGEIKTADTEVDIAVKQNDVVVVTVSSADSTNAPSVSVNGVAATTDSSDVALDENSTSAKVTIGADADALKLTGSNATATKVVVTRDVTEVASVNIPSEKQSLSSTEYTVKTTKAGESIAVKANDVVTITYTAVDATDAISVNGVAATLDSGTATATIGADADKLQITAITAVTVTGVKVTRPAAADTSDTSDSSSSSSSGTDDPADEGTKTVLSDTEKVFDNSWGSAIEIDASSLSSVKAGDKLTFTVSAVEATPGDQGKKIGIQDANWGEIGDGIYIDITDPATVEYTITAEALDKIKGGIKIKGVNITVSEVALITFGSAEDPGDDTSATTPAVTEAPSNPGYVVITPDDTTAAATTTAAPEVVTGANGESVEAPKDVIPSGATLEAKEQTKEEAVKAVEAVKATDANKEVVETVKKAIEDAKAAVMDINLVKDGQKVQPNGTIKVTIKVPEALKSAANLFVYRVEDNGTFTDVKATVKDGKIEFTTSHFSTYIITSEALTGDAVVTEAAATTTPAATTADGNTTTDDKNQATGVVLAIVPAVLAAAGVIAAKKRK